MSPHRKPTSRPLDMRHPADLLQAMIALATEARAAGWEINFAMESGAGERMTFAAQKPEPPVSAEPLT